VVKPFDASALGFILKEMLMLLIYQCFGNFHAFGENHTVHPFGEILRSFLKHQKQTYKILSQKAIVLVFWRKVYVRRLLCKTGNNTP